MVFPILPCLSEYQGYLYTSKFQGHLSRRESLVLVRMLRTISVFLFVSLPSHLANITIPQSADSGAQKTDITETETICLFWTFQNLMPLSFSHCRQRSSRARLAKIDDTRCKGAHIRQSGEHELKGLNTLSGRLCQV